MKKLTHAWLLGNMLILLLQPCLLCIQFCWCLEQRLRERVDTLLDPRVSQKVNWETIFHSLNWHLTCLYNCATTTLHSNVILISINIFHAHAWVQFQRLSWKAQNNNLEFSLEVEFWFKPYLTKCSFAIMFNPWVNLLFHYNTI